MVTNGYDVAVVALHKSDAYANQYSNARTAYYGIGGIPDCYFDGVTNVLGGGSGTYNAYLAKYNQRIVVPSYFSVGIFGTNAGTTYNIDLVLDEVDPYTSSDLRVHLYLTESNLGGYNYVCRHMAPDENGTTISFASGSQQQVSLSFTLDPSWVASECELVALIQDFTSKEVMQTSKVALDNLQPLAAAAGFTSSDTTACEGGSVDFYDASMGIVTSWQWTFEGGNPATSTDQNPTVSYAANGTYDVTQIVSDGTTWDTLTMEDYILVKAIPLQADQPTGPTDPCQGASPQYSTNTVQYASSYEWTVDPSDAGTFVGTGATATLNLSSTFQGSFDVKVRAVNECGDGAWSSLYSATAQPNPEMFTLSQGGGYCEGDPGIELTLDGSESGLDYELFLDDVSTGQIITGTGDVISFGYQTEEGIYTATGATSYCTVDMAGNSWIYLMEDPGTAAAPTGSTAECNNNQGTVYTTTGASSATSYTWSIYPEDAGIITGTDLEATVDWNSSFTGTAQINVQGENDCGTGNVSDNLDVDVYAAPTPVISGDTFTCQYYQGIVYTIANNPDNTYTWEISGGTIVSGAGTHEVSVDWGAPGQGWLRVTEESTDNCITITEDYNVTIDECVAIEEFTSENISIYPNPAQDLLYIEISTALSTELNIRIMDIIGKTVAEYKETANNGLLMINIADLNDGIYSIEISNSDTGRITKRLIKN